MGLDSVRLVELVAAVIVSVSVAGSLPFRGNKDDHKERGSS